ncbi:hypothetical protein ACJMK2_032360 [Sinanodonta woodiana]|uniref:Uncharacterized protein n=1 Tax=Sinanodonta woodiana TaxID=1069815 RepID=A0ABD3X3A8_SINWO
MSTNISNKLMRHRAEYLHMSTDINKLMRHRSEYLNMSHQQLESCIVDSSGQQDDDETAKLNKMDSKRVTRKFGEKVRRDRLNSYITELASEIPAIACHQRRVDKATVLRLTVSYLKLHHGLKKKKLTQLWRPKFLAWDKIRNVLDEATNGVLMVISKDGSILYVSSKVITHLGHTQVDLMGSNIQSYLHPDDVEMFESQFTMTDNNTNVVIENQSMSSPHRFNSVQGQNRTFYARFSSSWKNDNEQVNYKMLHITASLMEDSEQSDTSSDGEKNVWMVAVCRPVSQALDQELSLTMSEFQKDNEWVSQHCLDGKILFTDHRFSLITGIMASETRGKSPYLFLVMDDLDAVALSHSKIMDINEISSTIFRMKTVLGNEVYVESSSVIIKDSWTKKGKFIVSINRCLEEGEGKAKLAAQRVRLLEFHQATERLSITNEKDEDENEKVSTTSSSCSSKFHKGSVSEPGYFNGSSISPHSDYSSVDIDKTKNSKPYLSELPDTQDSSGTCSQFLIQMWQMQSSPFNKNQVSSSLPTAETWTASPNADIQQNSLSSFIPSHKQNFISLSAQIDNCDKFNNEFDRIHHAGSFPPKLKKNSFAGDSSCGSCSNDDYYSPNSTSSSKLSSPASTVVKKRQRDSSDELSPLHGMAFGTADSPDINLETDEKDVHFTKGIMGFGNSNYELYNNQDYRPEVTKPALDREERHGMYRLRRLLESEPVLDGNKSFPVGIYGSRSSSLDTVEPHQLDEVENQKQHLQCLASKLDEERHHKCSDNTL